MKSLFIVISFSFLLYGQTSLFTALAASTKDIGSDTAFYKRDVIVYKDLHDNSKPFNLNDLNQGKNIAIDLFTKYGDNILAMLACWQDIFKVKVKDTE